MITRRKVAEFGDDIQGIVEVYQKENESGRVFFDVVCASSCVVDSSRYLVPFVPVSRIPHLVMGVSEAMTYIARRYKDAESPPVRDFTEPSGRLHWSSASLGPDQMGWGGRKTVREFTKGPVIVEVYSRTEGEKDIFEIRCGASFLQQAERRREEYVQQRDLRKLIFTLAKTWIFLESYQAPVEGIPGDTFGNVSGIDGGFYEE